MLAAAPHVGVASRSAPSRTQSLPLAVFMATTLPFVVGGRVESAVGATQREILRTAEQHQAAPQTSPAATEEDGPSLRRKAELGDATAQARLGSMYAAGRGVEQNHAEAAKWWRQAADLGLADAQFGLGMLYETGQGGRLDYKEAAKWYRKAADQGLADAQFNLGSMYAAGRGVARDSVEAANWWSKAADQGLADAQFGLGLLYGTGQGVKLDDKKAAVWYRKAAEEGLADAQFNLAVLYASGRGVEQDYAEAVRWFRKAADRGAVVAQFNLGLMHAKGQGVPRDYVEAYKWFSVSAALASGDTRKKSAELRDSIARVMSAAHVADAEKQVGEWMVASGRQPRQIRLLDSTNSPPIRTAAIRPPAKVRNVNPLYPLLAQSRRVQGMVVIEATIGPDGKVSAAKVLTSVPMLDQAALDAVNQWEFTPTLLDGVAVSVIMTVATNFTLQ